MSASPQITDFLEQPKVPSPCVPPPLTSSLWGQLMDQPMPSTHTSPFKFIQFQTAGDQGFPDFSLPEWATQFDIERGAIVSTLDEEIRLLEYPRLAEHPREFQSFQREGRQFVVLRDPALKELEQAYVFDERSAVAAFMERNRIRSLLLEAREPLNTAFGGAAMKTLTLVRDDEGFDALFCLVMVPGDMQEARRALRSFDEQWWLAHSAQAGGKLNFDFELI